MAEVPFPSASPQEDTPWVSVSDLMSGLMLVFLFIAIAFMLNAEAQKRVSQAKHDQYANVAEQYSQTQLKLDEDLRATFPDGNPHGAQVIEGALIIRFLDKDAGYAPAQETVPPSFADKLGPFMEELLQIIETPAYKKHIVELRIEGHTSSDWYGSSAREAYLRNMDLSQARALNVLRHVMGLERVTGSPNTEEWLQSILRANGMSSSQRLFDGNKEDLNRSKRVEFRIVTDAETRMQELLTFGQENK